MKGKRLLKIRSIDSKYMNIGTLLVLGFTGAFVILAGPGGIPSFPFNSDCNRPVYDTPCGKQLADDDPRNPCLCANSNDTIPVDGLDIVFEANVGQAPPGVRYVARPHSSVSLAIGGNRAALEFRTGQRIEIELEGSNEKAQLVSENQLPGVVNYFLGNQPQHWFRDIPTFSRVRLRNAYPGIDVIYYGRGAQLEHDFVISPGADPSRIRYRLKGVDSHALSADGELVLRAGQQEVRWKKPALYQLSGNKRQHVEGRFRMHADGSVGFEIGRYDPVRQLVIDPVVLYATYLGKSRSELGSRVGVDRSGNIYLVGISIDPDFPTSSGVFKTPAGATDRPNVTISKLRPDGGAMIYSTYIGGQDSDIPGGIALDADGNLFIAGYTGSLNFPVTSNALQRSAGDPAPQGTTDGDCFVLKLNSAGNNLMYSTYLGGNNSDTCTAIAVDARGNAYVTGLTSSFNMPRSENAFQYTLRGGQSKYDGFTMKLNPTGSSVLQGTYFGGNGLDAPTAIGIDNDGNTYVAGFTNSNTGFPVTEGAFQTRLSSDTIAWLSQRRDAFLLKFNSDVSQLTYGTLLGGTKDDLGLALAVDKDGFAYVAGSTASEDFPTTSQAYQTRFRGSGGEPYLPGGDAFIAKVSQDGKSLVYSTLLGGSRDERIMAIALDARGNAWLTGNTLSTDFPVSTDAVRRTYGGAEPQGVHLGDAFLAQLDASGRSLISSTFIGGAGEDIGVGLAIDQNGSVLVAGGTTSTNLGATQDAVQRTFGGTQNALLPLGDSFLIRIGDPPPATVPAPSISSISSAASFVAGSIAPGEMFVLTGANLGPTATSAVAEGAALTAILGGVRVLFDGEPAPLASVSAARILAVAPFRIADRSSTKITVEYQNSRSPEVTLPVVAAKPGLFSADASGSGMAVLFDVEGAPLQTVTPDSIVTIIGTGAGVTEPLSNDGEIANDSFPPLAQTVTVAIGDTQVEEVFFSGGIKGRVAGIFQVQFRVPASLAPGDYPLQITVGTVSSQTGVVVTVVE